MLIVSSRKDFTDPDHLSDEDQVRNIPDHVNASNYTKITKQYFLNIISNKKILVLVHGYNNRHKKVLEAYDIIKEKVINYIDDNAYDEIIGYSWPGGDHKHEYFSAKNRSDEAAIRLLNLLIDMKNKNSTMDVLAHSMGNRVIFDALKGSPVPLVRNVFSMAAAVNDESLEPGEEFSSSIEKCDRIFVFHSTKDIVLKMAYKSAERDRALGYSGLEDISYALQDDVNIWTINCKKIVKAHGGYKKSKEVFKHINMSLTTDNLDKFITLK